MACNKVQTENDIERTPNATANKKGRTQPSRAACMHTQRSRDNQARRRTSSCPGKIKGGLDKSGRIGRRRVWTSPSEEPHVEEKKEDGEEEPKPDLPAHARALGHTKHAVHVSADPHSGILE